MLLRKIKSKIIIKKSPFPKQTLFVNFTQSTIVYILHSLCHFTGDIKYRKVQFEFFYEVLIMICGRKVIFIELTREPCT